MSTEEEVTRFLFNSEPGHALISRIIQLYVPYIPHDYVLEGVGHILDRTDLVAITPTGSGKTGFMAFTALVVRELATRPELYPEARGISNRFPKYPLMLTICPTNYMEYQLEEKLSAISLNVIIINQETTQTTHEHGLPDLWRRAQDDNKLSMILISPEQLKSQAYASALGNPSFHRRIYALSVDEVHLLLTWGKSFRQPFRQIGLARSRLPDNTVLISMTATMRGGHALDTICSFLGLKHGDYHLIRRSNQRHDIQLIFREISSPVSGRSFPELDWILNEKRTTIIFTKYINLANRLHEYMYHRDKALGGDPRTVLTRMREYNALSEEYNEITRKAMQSGECSIIFATSSLSIGVDIDNVEDVVVFGDPVDTDEMLQMIGRIRPRFTSGNMDTRRGIIYFSPNASKRAAQAVAAKNQSSDKKFAALENTETEMDITLAEIWLADCKVSDIDRQYENPEGEDLCHCLTCTKFPRISKRDPCQCSGSKCSPEPSLQTEKKPKQPPIILPGALTKPKKHQNLTAGMRTHGIERLKDFRLGIFRSTSLNLAPEFFFSNEEIKLVLDYFASLKEVSDLAQLLPKNKRLVNHHQDLMVCLQQLHGEFVSIRAREKLERAEGKKAKEALIM